MPIKRPFVIATSGRFCALSRRTRHTENMKSKKLKIAWGIILVPLIYWNATAAMIDNSARHVDDPQGCIVWVPFLIPFSHTAFLRLMGRRAIPALRRQIADPKVSQRGKIYIAWMMGQAGDNSQFPVLIQGLRSKRHETTVINRMADFPAECQRHLPAILAVGRQQQSDDYQKFLISLAYQNDVPDDKMEEIGEIMYNAQSNHRGFNGGEIQQLRQNFAAKTKRKSRYWATGATSDKNSSNAARQ